MLPPVDPQLARGRLGFFSRGQGGLNLPTLVRVGSVEAEVVDGQRGAVAVDYENPWVAANLRLKRRGLRKIDDGSKLFGPAPRGLYRFHVTGVNTTAVEIGEIEEDALLFT